jgi:hypothetical protein
MSNAPTWDTMPLTVPTRLMTKPYFQRRRQEEIRGSVMIAIRRDTQLAHVLTKNVKALCYKKEAY